MRLDANKLSSAVRLALTLGTLAAAGTLSANAQDAGNPPPANQKSQALETIVVTGSNIRRVDIETANPVITIDQAAIRASGKVNLGDLVQALPSMSGQAWNNAVNNGGNSTAIGTQGQSGVSLRGLGSFRTLLLLNGHRIPFQLQDLNIVPVSAVERIEVLNDGASSVYGSDAIAGVVNIITRTNYQGMEAGADYGITDRDDGQRKATHLLMGETTDKGSILVGVKYDKQDPVSTANRAFSKYAQYIYNTGINPAAGSSRTPGGRFYFPAGSPLIAKFGCSSVTVSGNQLPSFTTPPTLGQFRCYSGATDAFNYQAIGNYDLMPSERTGLFALGNYKITDNIEAYTEILYHKTSAHTRLAPYPFDLVAANLVVPANQYYNPFGQDFGTFGDSNNIRMRLTAIGDRGLAIANTTGLANFGLKGTIDGTSWNWDAHFSYGKETQLQRNLNYVADGELVSGLTCTTAPGAGSCTPIDIFNQTDPATEAALKSAAIDPYLNFMYQMKQAEASANGTLLSLPAGDMQASIGASDRKEYLDFQVDPLVNSTYTVNNGVAEINCLGPSSLCSSPAQGGFSVKEAYAELLVPVLKDLPFVQSLNFDLGDRYSRYSNFGSTNNWKAAAEYRPIEDLLLRATASKVFRAPTPTNLYAGPFADAPTAIDPCAGNPGLASNKLCQGYNVPPQTVSQLTGYVMGSQFAAAHGLGSAILQPEHGNSFDYGFVYDPHWVQGLSINADLYRITLNNLITSGPGIAQSIFSVCEVTQGPICGDIVRNPDGSIKFVSEAAFNSGDLVDQGFDVGAHYRLRETPFGNFRLGFDATYIQKWNITYGNLTQHLAGHFDKTYGNFARVRALATLDWNMGPFVANWTTRYIGPIKIGYVNAGLGPSGVAPSSSGNNAYNPNPIGPVLHYGSVTYHNFSVGYNIEPLNTFVQVGVDNVFDKQPPLFYQNNVTNNDTDVHTYDTVGRYYHASVTVKF